MARLLSEEEHEALLADRERLEWAVQEGASWYERNKVLYYDCDNSGQCERIEADNFREAIDKARSK